MWVSSSILDAASSKIAGKLDGSPKRVPLNHLFTWRRLVGPGHWARRQRSLASCATNVCAMVGRFMTTKKRREPAWTTTPSGFPKK